MKPKCNSIHFTIYYTILKLAVTYFNVTINKQHMAGLADYKSHKNMKMILIFNNFVYFIT